MPCREIRNYEPKRCQITGAGGSLQRPNNLPLRSSQTIIVNRVTTFHLNRLLGSPGSGECHVGGQVGAKTYPCGSGRHQKGRDRPSCLAKYPLVFGPNQKNP